MITQMIPFLFMIIIIKFGKEVKPGARQMAVYRIVNRTTIVCLLVLDESPTRRSKLYMIYIHIIMKIDDTIVAQTVDRFVNCRPLDLSLIFFSALRPGVDPVCRAFLQLFM